MVGDDGGDDGDGDDDDNDSQGSNQGEGRKGKRQKLMCSSFTISASNGHLYRTAQDSFWKGLSPKLNLQPEFQKNSSNGDQIVCFSFLLLLFHLDPSYLVTKSYKDFLLKSQIKKN
jgi:hypothetical protein